MAESMQLTEAKRALLDSYIRTKQSSAPRVRDGIPPRAAPGVAPLSPGQESVWFVEQLAPGSPTYNISTALRIRGMLDVGALRRAIDAIVHRHEALRTTFRLVEGRPMQDIASSVKIPLPSIDLEQIPHPLREAQARLVARAEAARPLRLDDGPLVRTQLIRLDPHDHLLQLTLHHIISDEWSVGVFLRELAALYSAFTSGARTDLPGLPIQFADFAAWQHQRLSAGTLDDQLDYWRRQLLGAADAIELYTDRPRLPVPTFKGALYTTEISREIAAGLRELSRRDGVTLFMVLLASLQILLWRYTGQDDLLVGAPIAGRTRPDLENLIGFFVNILVLRADLSDDPTVHQFLGRVRETTVEAYSHQEVPFERVVERLAPRREPNRNPLFQVVLALEPPLPPLPDGWSLEETHVDNGTAKFDLTLEIEESPEGLRCRWEYSTELFDVATIAQMAGHWQQLLHGIVGDPEAHVSALPLLTPAERRQMLSRARAESVGFPAVHCLHELFEEQVKRTPGARALSFEGQDLTYRELNARADRLARRLRLSGVGPEEPVALLLERTPELVVAILGVLKAGGYYVPLDPAYPRERLAYVLYDARPRVLLTHRPLLERALVLEAPDRIVLTEEDSAPADEKMASPDDSSGVPSGVTSDSLAYVIYTSGSTGTPKGVAVTHRNVVRLFEATDAWYHFNAADVWTLFHSYAFDFSVWELWGALLYGGRLIVVPYVVSRSPEAFHELLYNERVTVLNQTPSAFRQLMQADEASSHSDKSALRVIILGGEALDPKSLRRWFARHGDQHPLLVNMYGITETTVHVTYRPLTISDAEGAAGSVIGRPIPDLQVYILDRHREPVPVGVPGELYVGGAGLARGYLNRTELTAERFIRHPFDDTTGARLYKSGDLARVLPDGSLEYLGRIDDQVKVRGFRIELGEIQAILNDHPAVRETVVVAREDGEDGKRLVAYVVARGPGAPEVSELRRHAKERLPDYMVPVAFVLLDALPLTPNGKIDRRALPPPATVGQGTPWRSASALSPLHRELIQIWEELLETRPIGIEDDFFDLGGHSLLATRLLDRIQHVFGKRLPVAELFAGATIERLARVLGQDAAMVAVPRQPPTRAKDRDVTAHRPFFFLHGDYRGDPLWCLNIARALAADHPLHLLPPGRLDGRVAPTMRDFAAAHLEALRAVQPEGPYLLGGWCNGALVAYEMAQQLFEEGQRVDLLVLMETAFVTPREQVAHSIVERAGNVLGLSEARMLDWYVRSLQVSTYAARALSSLSYRLRKRSLGYLAIRGSAELRKAAALLRRPAQASGHEHASGQASVRPREEYLEVFSWMADRYTPRCYPGTIALFWSREEPLDGKSRSTGWRIAAGASEVTVQVVPGTHMTCRTEHVHALAERLRTCLTVASQVEATGAVPLAATGRTRSA